MGIVAEVICDSLHPNELSRLTTVRARIHRYVLAELNTHRAFSRNSASSRAIPFDRQLARVMNDPAMPIEWGRNQPGMQAGESIDEIDQAREVWLAARDAAVEQAELLSKLGVHKQVVNRLLEPFMWHTVVITSSEWENFFTQRCSPLAQPEIRVAAEAIRDAIENSTPRRLSFVQGTDMRYFEHLPFITENEALQYHIGTLRAASVARCARTSYDHDGGTTPDIGKDTDLFSRLIMANPMHASPLEHVAMPVRPAESYANADGRNFGPLWRQYRAVVERQQDDG